MRSFLNGPNIFKAWQKSGGSTYCSSTLDILIRPLVMSVSSKNLIFLIGNPDLFLCLLLLTLSVLGNFAGMVKAQIVWGWKRLLSGWNTCFV